MAMFLTIKDVDSIIELLKIKNYYGQKDFVIKLSDHNETITIRDVNDFHIGSFTKEFSIQKSQTESL